MATEPGGNIIVGRRAMDHLCKTQAGPWSLAATVEEFLRAGGPLTADQPIAWILPSRPLVVYLPDQSDNRDWEAWDAAYPDATSVPGLSRSLALANLGCFGHRSSSSSVQSLVAGPDGTPSFSTCEVVAPIACSSPVEIPVPPGP